MLAADFFRLDGCQGLVIGVANGHSMAYGCARAFRTLGADLAITYLNGKAALEKWKRKTGSSRGPISERIN